jgi:hypothetical protein
LASSGSFEHGPRIATLGELPKPGDPILPRGHRGGVIEMHRALAHFRLGPLNLVTAISLFVCFSSIWLLLLPRICRFWALILEFGIRVLPLRAEIGLTPHHLTTFINFDIPFLRMEPVLPTAAVWGGACIITGALFGASFFLSDNLIPVMYLLRGSLLVPMTALLYFVFLPARFPHTPDSYMEGLMTAGIALISVIPLLFGLTYYIFDFGLPKKGFLTIIAMTHLALFLPMQMLLQALFLQKTVLFMPVLYIIFGMPVNILMIVAFYSWGMTWSFRKGRAV